MIGNEMQKDLLREARIDGAQAAPRSFVDHAKPKWLEEKPLVMAGAWEGWHHLARNNFIPDDTARRRYLASRSRQFVQRLADAGCTLLICSFWKGLGLEEEAEEMALAAQTAQYCHEAGLRVGVYIGDTIYYEALREEVPDCEDWAMRDADGNPIVYGTQNWRYRACKNNPEYREYVKKVLRRAVVDANVDMIHFDNVFSEPYGCYCRWCDEGFQQFVLAKYPDPSERLRRFGIARKVRFALPRLPRHAPLKHTVVNTKDPVYTEWLDYRCQAMADAVKELAHYIRSLNLQVAVETNPYGILGHSNAFYHAVDHNRLLPGTDVFWSEEPEMAGVRDGKLICSVRSCKLSRATEQQLFLYSGRNPRSPYHKISSGDARVKMGEILAFAWNSAGCVSFIHTDEFELDAVTRRYIKFYKDHFDFYQRPVPAADVALWRSSRSLAADMADAHLAAVLWEQMLMQRHILFDLALDWHLQHLTRWKTIIIPAAAIITDEQLELLSRYVEHGGSLVIGHTSGLRNEQNVRRSVFPERTLWHKLAADGSSLPVGFEHYGKGRVAIVPRATQTGGVKPSNDLFWHDYLFNAYTNNWEIPANEGELLTALDWAGAGRQLITNASAFTVFDLVSSRDKRLLLHAVNFAPAEPCSVQAILRLPSEAIVKSLKVFSPDRRGNGEDIRWRQSDGRLDIRWRQFEAYDVIVIDLA